jgi:hypothetical protein
MSPAMLRAYHEHNRRAAQRNCALRRDRYKMKLQRSQQIVTDNERLRGEKLRLMQELLELQKAVFHALLSKGGS